MRRSDETQTSLPELENLSLPGPLRVPHRKPLPQGASREATGQQQVEASQPRHLAAGRSCPGGEKQGVREISMKSGPLKTNDFDAWSSSAGKIVRIN